MEVTKEQLAVSIVAKTHDIEKPFLTQIKLGADGRAMATNGHVIATIERDPVGPKKERFAALVPTSIARTVLDLARRDKGQVEIEEEGPTFFVTSDPESEDEPTALRYTPLHDAGMPDLEEALRPVLKTPPRARIAISSQYLAMVASLKTRVGDAGPIKFEIRGEADPVVATWRDDRGHRARVVIMPVKLEEWEWADKPAPEGSHAAEQLPLSDEFADEGEPGDDEEPDEDEPEATDDEDEEEAPAAPRKASKKRKSKGGRR